MNFLNKHLLTATITILVSTTALAQSDNEYAMAEDYFNNKEYKKALPLLEDEAQKGSKASMYRLGYMYENGLGVQKDATKAAYWYKQSAQSYSFTVSEMQTTAQKEKKPFLNRMQEQFKPSTYKEAEEFALLKMDTNTPETKSLIGELIEGDFFGIKPYETNYFLPFSYSSKKYNRVSSTKLPGTYHSEYESNTEVEFQLSLKKPLTYNLFGWNEYITAAYTQKVWWQTYSESSPFRETNYSPELFMSVPSSQEIDDEYGLKMMKYSFIHESNGREGYRSRSWNRIYASAQFQFENLFIRPRVWYRIPESSKDSDFYNGTDPNADGDDNPGMHHYLGYGDLTMTYLYGKHEMGALLRYNFNDGGSQRGAVDLHWSYPFFDSKNTFWFVKFFNGYGESLIDYDRSVTKTSFGFSFSRGLF
jgi:phospholipase A1